MQTKMVLKSNRTIVINIANWFMCKILVWLRSYLRDSLWCLVVRNHQFTGDPSMSSSFQPQLSSVQEVGS